MRGGALRVRDFELDGTLKNNQYARGAHIEFVLRTRPESLSSFSDATHLPSGYSTNLVGGAHIFKMPRSGGYIFGKIKKKKPFTRRAGDPDKGRHE